MKITGNNTQQNAVTFLL